MNAILEDLIILQAQDLELKRLREELAEAPRRVAAAEAAVKKSEAALASAKQSLAKEESLRKGHELDIADRKGKITRLRKQMETAANAAQIAALEHEITFSEQSISQHEDEELASMERTEGFEADLAKATDSLTATSASLAAERVRAADVLAKNTASVEGISLERSTLRSKIGATDEGEATLSSYDRIAKAKGTAVSEAVDHKCTVCQMMIRPQRWNDLIERSPSAEFANTIFTCETCGRMLFHDPRRDAPVRWTPGERLTSATQL
jgi:predicted  nucleic acid-binding Zn-ribbon protein